MATVNRPVVGTVTCPNPGCDESATVHQVEKGSRKGQLYSRCPKCGCNQSGGKTQDYYKTNMEPRPGYESLATDKNNQDEKTEQVENLEAETEETETDEPEPEKETKKGGAVMAGLAIVGILAGAILGGRR